MTRIYTKTGDQGETGLFSGTRVTKDNPLLDAYGTVDELNAVLGCTLTYIHDPDMREKIERLQSELFEIGADLASPWENRESTTGKKTKRIPTAFAEHLEKEIDAAEAKLKPLRQFILPGGSKPSAWLHLARTVCRRAERHIVALLRGGNVNPNIVVYMNRLSDWLFVYARFLNAQAGVEDVPWKST